MGFFVFIGLVIAGAVAIVFGIPMLRGKRNTASIPLTRIAIAVGEAEAQQWRMALKSAGIWSRIIGETATTYPGSGMDQELWVREKDAEHARAVLGIN